MALIYVCAEVWIWVRMASHATKIVANGPHYHMKTARRIDYSFKTGIPQKVSSAVIKAMIRGTITFYSQPNQLEMVPCFTCFHFSYSRLRNDAENASRNSTIENYRGRTPNVLMLVSACDCHTCPCCQLPVLAIQKNSTHSISL